MGKPTIYFQELSHTKLNRKKSTQVIAHESVWIQSCIDMHNSHALTCVCITTLGVPTIGITKTRLLGHKLTVSFAHPNSYPKESTLRDELKYAVVQIDTSKRSSDVTTTVCSSTSDNVEITGGLASSIKVKVYYGNRRDLGIISSETYKSRLDRHGVIEKILVGVGDFLPCSWSC